MEMGELVKRKNILAMFIVIPLVVSIAFDFMKGDGVDNKMLYEFQQTLDRKIDRNSSYRFTSGGFNGISKSGKIGKFYSCLRKYQLVKRVNRNIPEMMGLDPEDIITKNIIMLIDGQIELELELSNAVVTRFIFGMNGDYSYFASYCDLKLLNIQ
ncbi:hypothetical protein [Vibrio mangrovi]|uniref:Uncharacterized protein n=1 Tax=Vibrio mangrovi TaxID=474394 RepID=A0A1Y6IWV1_9VIBR|nr:hypothetical protein [Vibrio mangrovi]MDW6002146.1 hypothetical protein [Vibrio mangrovi]SMS01491.1 hypothetical protein VIM7927_02787 [Vibrio mangrovi]